MGLDVSQSDVRNVDEWLGVAAMKWIIKASSSDAGWLFLLLGSNVDVPVKRVVDFDVFIEDVSDFTST